MGWKSVTNFFCSKTLKETAGTAQEHSALYYKIDRQLTV